MSNNHTRPLRMVLVGDGGDGAVIRNILDGIRTFHCVLCIARQVNEVLTLASEHEFDLILLDLSKHSNTDLGALERVCEAFSSIPIVVLVERDAQAVSERALRLGVREAIVKSALTEHNFTRLLSSIVESEHSMREQKNHLHVEQALRFLQHHPVSAHVPPAQGGFGMKPLSEAMPYKFLELTKSYSNLMELAASRTTNEGNRFSGHSVSRKLHFLASDLGALKAGVWDVIDLHAKAVEEKHSDPHAHEAEHQKILLELISDLVSFYRKSEYVNA